MIRATLSSLFLALATLTAGCAHAPEPGASLLNDVATALGGAEQILTARTLKSEGSGTVYRVGQNYTPTSDLPSSAIISYQRQTDLANRRTRTEQVADSVDGVRTTTVFAVDGEVAWSVTAGREQRLDPAAANNRVMNYYHHPLTLLRAALEEGAAVVVEAQDQSSSSLAVTIGRNRYVMRVDRATKLPISISSTVHNVMLGDAGYVTTFGNYTDIGTLHLPRSASSRLDGWPYNALVMNDLLDAPVSDLAAPASVRSATSEPAPVKVSVEPLAPGVWRLAGGSHHSVLVELETYAVVIEAPQDQRRTLAVVAKARELLPDKPLKYMVNTHHHHDHAAGLRAAVAEGFIIVTHETNLGLIENLTTRPRTLAPDRLSSQPRALSLLAVRGEQKLELRDGQRTLEIFPITEDTHSAGNLMIYHPGEKIIIEADVFTPGRPAPGAANLLDNILRRKLQVEQVVPLHGEVVPFSELQRVGREARRE